MKFTQKDEVFKDQETGVCYTRVHAVRPTALISSPGKSTSTGVLLTPYGGHELAAWDESSGIHGELSSEKFGFVAGCYGQDLFVTDEMFETRFVSLGILSKEVDLEAVMRQYEEECCNFSNRAAVAKSVRRRLQQMVPALSACELYVLLKDYEAHTPTA